jgi:leucyl aminopeptidase
MPDFLSIDLSEQTPKSAQALVFYANEKGSLGPVGGAIWARTGLDFERIAQATGFGARPGHMIDIPAPSGRIALCQARCRPRSRRGDHSR